MDNLPHRQREPKYGGDSKQVDAGYEMHDVSGVPAYQRLKRHAGQQGRIEDMDVELRLRMSSRDGCLVDLMTQRRVGRK
jgi:hypothetical protein